MSGSLVDMLHGRSDPAQLAALDGDVRLLAFVIEEPIARNIDRLEKRGPRRCAR